MSSPWVDDPFAHARELGVDVAPVPPSHWESRGFDPGVMRIVQEAMMRCIIDVHRLLPRDKYADDQVEITLKHDYSSLGQEVVLGPSVTIQEEALLPMWEALTDAIRDTPTSERRGGEDRGIVLKVTLRDFHLSPAVMGMLERALMGKDVYELTIDNAKLGAEALKSVAKVIQQRPFPATLSLSSNAIEDLEAATSLFSAATGDEPSIIDLVLKNCNIGSDIEVLKVIVDGVMNTYEIRCDAVNLDSNNIGPEGGAYIGRALGMNPTVDTLDLNDNNLGDEGLISLANGLRSNTNLSNLYIENSGSTEVGCDALRKAIIDTSSLNAIADSNHTCEIECDRYYDDVDFDSSAFTEYAFAESRHRALNEHLQAERRLENQNTHRGAACIASNRARKVLITLGATKAETHIDISYLTDLPLELIPRSLKYVQQKVKDNDDVVECHDTPIVLKNVFQLVKTFVVPILFAPQAKAAGAKRRKMER